MYKKIIVGLGLSHGHGEAALDLARLYLPDDHTETVSADAMKGIEERIGPKKDATPKILTGNAGSTLIEYAETVGADCIIVGSHKPDMQDYLLGSTAARVARHAPCAVHILR